MSIVQVLIANGTHHQIDFSYRIPEFERVLNVVIPPGRQTLAVPADMSDSQVEALIKQLEFYGARPATDTRHLESARALVYSVRKPVSSDQINAAREADENVRQRVADEQTEAAGMAVFPHIEGL